MRAIVFAALFGATSMAVGAAPAFTADNGSVTATVSMQAPAAPCLTVDPSSLDYGTMDFAQYGEQPVAIASCGSANQHTLVSATDADGPVGHWLLTADYICPGPVDRYSVRVNIFGVAQVWVTNDAALIADSGSPLVWAPGESPGASLSLYTPCAGSSGAGEAMTFTTTFTAVVA
jgi:hypothetical protein